MARGVSSKPSRVRYLFFNAPLHQVSKRLRCHLSQELRERYGTRSIRVRKGDTVRVVRGEYKGIEGKVTQVFPKEGRIAVEGVTREKIAGGTVPVKIHASKVVVTDLNLDDKWRKEKLERMAKEAQAGRKESEMEEMEEEKKEEIEEGRG